MIKNKLWIGDLVAGKKMLCKCQGRGKKILGGRGVLHIPSAVVKVAVAIAKLWLTTPT